ncbi:MAG: glutaredoxin domain-containing protein [Thermodesulfobacteriota bacterium]
MIDWIQDPQQLAELQQKHPDGLILIFYGDFSPASKRALAELEQFTADDGTTPVYALDVQKVKGAHKEFGVTSVPTVITLKNGTVNQRVEGVESAQFYARLFSGAQHDVYQSAAGTPAPRVIVYSGPGCPACGSAKAYLRRRGVRFREIDVARDQQAAKSLVKRSGQMAVPQIDINGRLIVGFDRAKIDRMLAT